METSDEEDEDGLITKSEQEEEKERKMLGKEEPITMQDLEKCRLSRDKLVKNYMRPWFQEFVERAHAFYVVPASLLSYIRRLGSVSYW